MLIKFKSNHTLKGVQYLKGKAVEVEDEKLKLVDKADYVKADDAPEEDAGSENKAPEEPQENKAVKKSSKK